MSSEPRIHSRKGFTLAIFVVIVAYAAAIPHGVAGEQEDRTRQLLFTQRDYYNHGYEIGDLSLYVGMYADDAVRISPTGTQRGIAEIERYFARSVRTWKAKAIFKSGVVQGNSMALQITWAATHRASGKNIELDFAVFVTFNDSGKRTSSIVYYDTSKMAKFLEEANAEVRQ